MLCLVPALKPSCVFCNDNRCTWLLLLLPLLLLLLLLLLLPPVVVPDPLLRLLPVALPLRLRPSSGAASTPELPPAGPEPDPVDEVALIGSVGANGGRGCSC